MFPRSWRMSVWDQYLHPHSCWLLSSHNNMCTFFCRNRAVCRRNPRQFALKIRRLSERTARHWKRSRSGPFTWADLRLLQKGRELSGPSNCLFAPLFLQYGTWQDADLFPMLLENAHSKLNSKFADFSKQETSLALGIRGCSKHLL